MERKTVIEELIDIFKHLPSKLKTDAVNDFQHYSYNSIQKIKEVVGQELKKRGILFIPEVVNVKNEAFTDISKEETEQKVITKEITKILTTVHFAFKFEKDSEAVTIHSYGQGMDGQGKGLAKAKSDAIKRLFTDMFLIASSDEDDEKSYGNTESKPAPKNYSQNNQKENSYTIKNPDEPITEAQKRAIYAIAKHKEMSEEDVHIMLANLIKGKEHVSDLTKGEASKFIDFLQES